jgi:hypothetical protein
MRRILLLIVVLYSLTSAGDNRGAYLDDSSDWWSLQREDSYGIKVKSGNTEIDERNFGIGQLSLHEALLDWMTKLGKTTMVSRGDAAVARSQICYESVKTNGTQYLIREYGEITESFYLFEGGPSWKGQDFCAKTSSAKWTTPTGLGLGINRSKVEAILGKPDAVNGDRIVYLRETKHKLSTKEFAEVRKNHPQMSEGETHEQFDFSDLSTFIDVRFSDSKLVYLAVSKIETY